MAEENNNQEQQENIDQDELAKQWEEALSQQQENTSENQESPDSKSEENVDQDELAKQWEEALSQQQEESQEETQENPSQDELAKQWEEALSQQEATESKGLDEELLKDLDIDKEKLELLLDIPLEISVEIGNKVIPLEDILKMTPNTIVELERYINEPVDIKVNGKLIAKGELYTVENNFGVKITSIITVQERMKLLMEEME